MASLIAVVILTNSSTESSSEHYLCSTTVKIALIMKCPRSIVNSFIWLEAKTVTHIIPPMGMPFSGLLSLAPLISALMVLAGCINAPPRDPGVLDVPLPHEWSAYPIATDGLTAEGWIETFHDANLSALVHEALRRNYDLKAAAARVEAARAQARIEGALRLPQLAFAANATRERDRLDGEPGNPPAYQTTLELLFNLSWEIDLWGRIRAVQEAAQSALVATAADLEAARLSLAARSAQVYFALIEAQLQVRVAERSVRDRQTLAALVRGRFRRGLARGLDLRLVLTDVANAEAQLAQARNQVEAASRQLEVLLGRYPEGKPAPGDKLPTLPEPVPAGLPGQLLGRRPDLRAAFARLRAEDWRVASAQAALLPTLTLTGKGGLQSGELRNLVDPGSAVWSAAGSLLQPLFTGDRLRNAVKLNQARVEEALNRYHETALTAFREVEQALAAEEWLLAQKRSLGESVRQTEASRKLAVYAYRHGFIDILTLLDSYRSTLNAESTHLAVKRELLTNRLNLYLALGGGIGEAGDLRLEAGGEEKIRELVQPLFLSLTPPLSSLQPQASSLPAPAPTPSRRPPAL